MLRLTLTRIALLLLFCLIPCLALAETISGTVLDPSGAVIAGARIEITGGDLSQAIVLVSDGLGKFTAADLKAGTYSLRVTRDGFETQVKTVDLHGPVQLEIKL